MDLKELLLKDLGARLPYGVICKSKYIEYDEIDGDDVEWDKEGKLEVVGDDYVIINSYQCELDETKPYLRPMSSMTEEEIKELSEIDQKRIIFSARHLTWHLDGEVIDYLNKKMFDWRGLIHLNLALAAPKGMYGI